MDAALQTGQAATAPPIEVNNRRPHYAFSPGETILMTGCKVGFNYLPRARFRLLEGTTYAVQNVSPEELSRTDDSETALVMEEKTAAQVADEINYAYSHRGVVIVDPLIGARPELVQWVQNILVPDVPDTLIALISSLESVKLEDFKFPSERTIDENLSFLGLHRTARNDEIRAKLKSLLEETLRLLIEASRRAETFLRAVTQNVSSELNARKMADGKGLDRIDDTTRERFRLLDQAPPDDLLEQIAKAQNQPQRVVIEQPGEDRSKQVQCLKCGAFANLIVATGKPPALCVACKSKFPEGTLPVTLEAVAAKNAILFGDEIVPPVGEPEETI